MRRREFIGLVGGAVTWPTTVVSQQSKVPIVGLLSSSALQVREMTAFHRGLGEVGYVAGGNVTIEHRSAADDLDRLPGLAVELVHLRVAVIAGMASTPVALAAKMATQSIPIVFVIGSDPVENKIVSSLARPGENITGITTLAGELFEKRLTLLHELLPAVTRIGFLVNEENPAYFKGASTGYPLARTLGRRLGIELFSVNASTAADVGGVFARLSEIGAGALLVNPDTLFLTQRHKLVELAGFHAIPLCYFSRGFVELGGLMSYGSDLANAYRQAGVYVGRVLKGEKPADLPVLQPTKFELVINMKTAKALGIVVPPTLLARADELIE